MLLTGKIEVFKNTRGYLTGKINSFVDGKVVGTSFIDVRLAEGIKTPEGKETITYELKKAYLNSVHVSGEKPFDKLQISVVEAEVVKTYSVM